jgi:hypothetical protein
MKIEKRISLKASLNCGLPSDSENARLSEPRSVTTYPYSCGKSRASSIRTSWKHLAGPVCTSSHHGYKSTLSNLDIDRLGKSITKKKTKSSRRHLIARNQIHYKNFTMNDYMNKITTWALPRSWSSLRSSDVVLHARFPRRLGRP